MLIVFKAKYICFQTVSRKYRSTILSVIETSFGVGMMVGPSFGGLLYDLRGFDLPFSVSGGALMMCSLLAAIVLSRPRTLSPHSSLDELEGRSDTTYSQLLGNPSISVCFVIIILSEMALSWLLPSLDPFLNLNFALNSTLTGMLFSLEGITYALFSPLFGLWLDRGLSPYAGLVGGTICNIMGLCVIGPMPFLQFIPKSPYTSGVGMAIIG